jgi:hypothetical protein
MEQSQLFYIALGALAISFIFITYSLIRSAKLTRQLNEHKKELTDANFTIDGFKIKYADIFDVEVECSKIKEQLEIDNKNTANEVQKILSEAENNRDKATGQLHLIQMKISEMQNDYKEKKLTYDTLSKQVAIYRDDMELIELGFYEPIFDFDSSEKFKEEIKKCKDRQKALIKVQTSSGAIYCHREWLVDGSRAQGRKMTTKSIRLTARAFNNECEAAIAKCTWRNVVKMEERIKKAFYNINQLNQPNEISITERYLNEKLQELQLTYEYHEKKQYEKDEQAEIKAQMREDARIEAEIRKTEAEAIKEEKMYIKALGVARKELSLAGDEMKVGLEKRIAELQFNLEEAERKHQRARSMAEQTKQGHIYIISNIGSFGENIYKIGMTRRLEPMERVKELGDASVPFIFDVHAMIHTEDAPTLEKKLHETFESNRLNKVNRRKEFFCVTLDEIENAVSNLSDHEVEFIKTAVAQDYYETQSMLKQRLAKAAKIQNEILTTPVIPAFTDAL